MKEREYRSREKRYRKNKGEKEHFRREEREEHRERG